MTDRTPEEYRKEARELLGLIPAPPTATPGPDLLERIARWLEQRDQEQARRDFRRAQNAGHEDWCISFYMDPQAGKPYDCNCNRESRRCTVCGAAVVDLVALWKSWAALREALEKVNKL